MGMGSPPPTSASFPEVPTPVYFAHAQCPGFSRLCLVCACAVSWITRPCLVCACAVSQITRPCLVCACAVSWILPPLSSLRMRIAQCLEMPTPVQYAHEQCPGFYCLCLVCACALGSVLKCPPPSSMRMRSVLDFPASVQSAHAQCPGLPAPVQSAHAQCPRLPAPVQSVHAQCPGFYRLCLVCACALRSVLKCPPLSSMRMRSVLNFPACVQSAHAQCPEMPTPVQSAHAPSTDSYYIPFHLLCSILALFYKLAFSCIPIMPKLHLPPPSSAFF